MEYTDATLDALRLEGDPFADKVITDIEAAGEVDAVNLLIRHLITNNQPVPEQLPPVVQDYLKATDNPPEGVALTKALIDYYESLMLDATFDGAVPALVRTLTGDTVATMMEIPPASQEWVTANAFRLGSMLDKVDLHHALMRHIVEKMSYELILAHFYITKGGAQYTYDIPDDLQASWQLDVR